MVSKSGTTTEPAIAFRIFRELLVKKYGEKGANQRIYATTDAKRGALKTEADDAGWETFVIPDGVGGRYSVLSAVGLLPIAVSGADIDQLMAGAAGAEKSYTNPNMTMFAEWWKQLAGESEGKDQKGIYPSSANFTTDLHSLGQYIQEGMRNLMETVVKLDTPNHDVTIPAAENDLDGLAYLQGKNMDWVNTKAYQAVVAAHNAGGVPVMTVHIPREDEYTLGSLIYFFEVAMGISGYLNGINPFNQPGVEAYKTNMFGLLGKPGFEAVGDQLRAQMKENEK